MIRTCPLCAQDSIVGHGWRSKQAHDETHDWIPIRRGLCNLCHTTFTLLPCLSLPYTHYSLAGRSQALQRYFLEDYGWEGAAPVLKDPNRSADTSTLRRWFRSLDGPPFSRLRAALEILRQWMAHGKIWVCGDLELSGSTVFAFLRVYWPLRI
jgi:hypothetical protein